MLFIRVVKSSVIYKFNHDVENCTCDREFTRGYIKGRNEPVRDTHTNVAFISLVKLLPPS